MASIDGKTTGLSKEVYGALKQLQATRKGEALTENDVESLVKTMAKDGKIDDAELDLINEIMANSVEVKIAKNDHDSTPVTVKFSGAGKTNIKEQALEKAADVARRSAMYKRASDDRGVSGKDELIRILKTDQKLAGSETTGKTKYGTKGDVATKILIQDGILLQRKGLITPDDQTFLAEMAEKRSKMKPLTGDEITRLDNMVEKALAYLEGPNPEIKQVDQGSLIDLGSDTAGTPDAQYEKVEQNFESLVTEANAAVNDVTASTGEVGLNQETMKEQKAADVEGGRNFERIAEAVEEADRQFLLLHDNVIPAVKKQIESLDAQADQRLMELTGKKTIEEAKEALKQDPKLREAARLDSKLQGIFKKRDNTVDKLETLSVKMLALGDARVKGIKSLKEIKIIDKEMKARIASVKGMSAELNTGILSLNLLRNSVIKETKSIDQTGTAATQIESSETKGTTNQEQLDDLKRKELELAGAEWKLKLSGPKLEALKKQSDEVVDQMVKGMDSLIAKYEATSTCDKTALQALKDERALLLKLKDRFNTSYDPVQAVKDLDAAHAKILGTLKKLVPAHLDIREYKALAALDGNVSAFGGAHQDFKDSYDYAKGRMQFAQNSIGSARELVLASEEDLKAAIERAEKGQDSVLEETTSLMEGVKDETTHKDGLEIHAGLSYGSHARVYLGIGVGVGADIGVLEAKVAIGLEGALKIEKSFGSGPSYLMHADLAAKITAEISLDVLFAKFSASAELKAGLSVGLGFDKPGDMYQFGKDVAEFVANCLKLSSISNKDEAKALLAKIESGLAKIEKTVAEHKYKAAFVESKVEVEVESKSAPGGMAKAELKGGINIGSYADGSVVEDKKVGGLVQLGEFGLEVTRETSTVTKQPDNGEKRVDSSRTVVEFKVPVSVLKEVMKHGLGSLPKGVFEEVVKTLKSANPTMAGLEASVMMAALTKSLSGNTKGLAKLVAAAERVEKARGHSGAHHSGPVKKEVAISIGISAGHNSHGKDFVAIEFNIEGKIDFKKDIGGGTNFVRIEAGASAKVGIEFEVAWGGGAHH